MIRRTYSRGPLARLLVLVIGAVTAGLLAPGSDAMAGDWPAYRADVARSAAVREKLAFPMRLLWRYTPAQEPEPAWPDSFRLLNRMDFDYAPHPVIAGGRVYFGSTSDDTVRALDAGTGKEAWHFAAGGPVRFSPQVVEGSVYFASDDGFVYCVEAATGKLSWKFFAGPAEEQMVANHRMVSRWPLRTGVLVSDGVVYLAAGLVSSEGTFVYALDAKTGAVVWCNDTAGGTPQGPLLANAELLLVPNAKQPAVPFDRKTGRVVSLKQTPMTGGGGTWATIDNDTSYQFAMHRSNVLSVYPISLKDAAVQRAWGAGVVPQTSIGPAPSPGRAHERAKVNAVISGGRPYVRKAYGIALAGDTLVLGQEGRVTAERAAAVKAAELQFGAAGDDLLVYATVIERNITQAARDDQPWKGTCVEVFGALPDQKRIGQVFLVPQTATQPARAFRTLEGKVVPAPEIRIQTTATAGGFELSALVPLPMLALDQSRNEFLLEAQVTVTGPDGTFQRDTLFGSETPHQSVQNFRRLKMRALPDTLAVGKVKASIRPEVFPVTLRDAGLLWSAEVDGEAREVATADGRIFVSTHHGTIYCFGPGDAGAAPVLHTPPSAPAAQATVSGPAEKILADVNEAGMDRGFALVLGDADGRVSMTLAARTRLQIINATADESAASALRERLLKETAWHGSRIHVQCVKQLARLPFPQYFANAVIVASPTADVSGRELYRVLRPCGGILLLPGLDPAEKLRCMNESGASPGEATQLRGEPVIVRGKLPGAADWNTDRKAQPYDQRLSWPIRPLWIGGPSTSQVQNFGEDARSGAIPANGRLFLLSEQALTAVDAYNGAILWSRPVPKNAPSVRKIDGVLHMAIDATFDRASLGRLLRPTDDTVVLMLESAFTQGKGPGSITLDARTGEQVRVATPFNPPTPLPLTPDKPWPVAANARQLGDVAMAIGAQGVVITLNTKDSAVTPLDAWDLYFDFRPIDQRYGLYNRGAFHVRVVVAQDKNMPATWSPGSSEGSGAGGLAECPRIEVTGTREADGTRTAVVLPWSELERLVGARPASCDFAATLNAVDRPGAAIARHHLFGDWAADGINNGWARVSFVDAAEPAGPIKVPAIFSVPAPAVSLLARPAVPPAMPAVSDLLSVPGQHPLTGEPVPKITGMAPVCGGSTRAGNLIFGQSMVFDLADNSGVRALNALSGVKTGCSTPQVAALGLMVLSEERGHCICNYAYHTTVVAAPAERRLNEDWARFYDRDIDTLLRTACINLGAPGDRRDASGNLWLGFPRNDKLEKTADHTNPDHPLAYPVGMRDAQTGLWHRRDLRPAIHVPLEVEKTIGRYHFNADRTPITGTQQPWLYASGYRGINKATLRLNFFKQLASTEAAAPPNMDGKLDDACWNHPPRGTDATPALPYTGTHVLFRHDAKNLYVGVQRPPMIKWGRAERTGSAAQYVAIPQPWQKGNTGNEKPEIDRLGKPQKKPATPAEPGDTLSPKDNWWRLIISDRHAKKAVYLTLTPAGVHTTAIYDESKNQLDRTWNAPWRHAVLADDKAMTIETEVPWATLESAGLERESLAVNFFMYDPGLGCEALTYLGIEGMNHCTNFTPLGIGKPRPIDEREFAVRLHFAEPDNVKPGDRVFDVKLQGQVVLKDFDIAKEAGIKAAVIKEFKNVKAGEAMVVEFVSHAKTPTPESVPILSALEVNEEGGR